MNIRNSLQDLVKKMDNVDSHDILGFIIVCTVLGLAIGAGIGFCRYVLLSTGSKTFAVFSICLYSFMLGSIYVEKKSTISHKYEWVPGDDA